MPRTQKKTAQRKLKPHVYKVTLKKTYPGNASKNMHFMVKAYARQKRDGKYLFYTSVLRGGQQVNRSRGRFIAADLVKNVEKARPRKYVMKVTPPVAGTTVPPVGPQIAYLKEKVMLRATPSSNDYQFKEWRVQTKAQPTAKKLSDSPSYRHQIERIQIITAVFEERPSRQKRAKRVSKKASKKR